MKTNKLRVEIAILTPDKIDLGNKVNEQENRNRLTDTENSLMPTRWEGA